MLVLLLHTTHRLLQQRSSMLPTLVARSSRHALAALRALHHTLAIYGLGEFVGRMN
jgi:hypothetical protein